MSPGCLRALSRQRLVLKRTPADWLDLYEMPLKEFHQSAPWYRRLLWDLPTPTFLAWR